MKILHVTEPSDGGAWNIIRLLASRQASDGHDVTVVYSVRSDALEKEGVTKGFHSRVRFMMLPMVASISPFTDLRGLLALYKIISLDFDVVHLHSSKAGVLGRVASCMNLNRKPCFYTPHGFSFLRRDVSKLKCSAFRAFEKIAARLAGITLACSESEKQHAQSLFPQNNVILIENAVDVKAIKPVKNANSGICRIATTGRLCPPKNPSAFTRLAAEFLSIENVSFLWIGGGDLEADLLIDGKRPNNLTATGWITGEEVASHLQETDIFVMTSLWEGMPLSLLEAQTAGLPAVVPDVEGCRDVVIDGVTGYICRSFEEMRARIHHLIENRPLRRALGDEARVRALARFSGERMHTEVMQAYGAEIAKRT